jgi:hypothetical protein
MFRLARTAGQAYHAGLTVPTADVDHAKLDTLECLSFGAWRLFTMPTRLGFVAITPRTLIRISRLHLSHAHWALLARLQPLKHAAPMEPVLAG